MPHLGTQLEGATRMTAPDVASPAPTTTTQGTDPGCYASEMMVQTEVTGREINAKNCTQELQLVPCLMGFLLCTSLSTKN